MSLTASFRPANPNDALHMAHLINFAGDGLPRYFWNTEKDPGQTDWDFGAERARRESGGFSFRNATVATVAGVVAGCTNQYRIMKPSDPADAALAPATFVPLMELEDLSVGTFHLNVLAVYPEFRGFGIGEALLNRALTETSDDQTLIVSDANIPAQQLYDKTGFRVQDSRPMIKDGWRGAGENWILMCRSRAASRAA